MSTPADPQPQSIGITASFAAGKIILTDDLACQFTLRLPVEYVRQLLALQTQWEAAHRLTDAPKPDEVSVIATALLHRGKR